MAIRSQLDAIIKQVQATIPNEEPLSLAHGNWSFPGLTRAELLEEPQEILALIDTYGGDYLGDQEAILGDYARRLQYLHANTVPNIWGSAAQGVAAYLMTLTGLRKRLELVFKDSPADSRKRLRDLGGQLRTLETRVSNVSPRTEALTTMVERIEQAYIAADNLPTDLKDLEEARAKIAELSELAKQDQVRILDLKAEAERIDSLLKQRELEAAEALEKCEKAYSGATSLGLAAAFSDRCKKLEFSMNFWIVGLIVALGSGSYFGSGRLRDLVNLFDKPDPSSALIIVNLLLAVISVGAPIWFAWLATKQIGHRFRLSEDYAFKASVARAYDGFRREAQRVDKALEAKLLESALTRLDEQPLRLVEHATHGSPWHELASSPTVKRLAQTIPDAVNQVADQSKRVLRPKTARDAGE